jgi:hypothetical protein
MNVAVLLAVLATMAQTAASFSSASSTSTPNAFGSLMSIFGSDPAGKEREELKTLLLEECREEKPSRERIEAIITDLASLSPTPNAASSRRLQKRWIL